MRNQWVRLLILRRHTPSQPFISQVQHLRFFTSSLPSPPAPHLSQNPYSLRRCFTSSPELAFEPPKPPSDQAALVADIFAKSDRSDGEIKLILDDKNVSITHDLILSVLGNPDTDTYVAKRVIDWVLENDGENLSCELYNLMFGILGGNGFVKESWDMIKIMKKKGYHMSKGSFDKVFERFHKDGLDDDVEKLKALYASGSPSCEKNDASEEEEITVEEDRCRVSDIIKSDVWGDDVEKQLRELDLEFSSDLVTRVLENLKMDPNKALIFFRWVQESGVFKHDQRSFNALARVLGEEDHSEKFWRVANEMRSAGHEMERQTYAHVWERFVEKEMINNAVDLYEFAMSGENESSEEDCILLLKKILVSKELDMDLFLKVVGVFKANGAELTDTIFDAIIKSLIKVERMNDECRRIFVAVKEAGYVPSIPSRYNFAFELSSGGKTELALAFMDTLVPSPDYLSWDCLVKGFCVYGNLDEASDSLGKMVEKEGVSNAMPSLDVLVGTYCRKNEPLDAYKLVSEMVNDKGLNPWYSSFKTITKGLLEKDHFKEALDVMSMIKKQGYPPYLYPFVEYLSTSGSAEDAITFTQAMTSKKFPATNVFMQLFEAYLTAGRLSEAQDFLSKCPTHIKNHADVLNLFLSQKSGVASTADVLV